MDFQLLHEETKNLHILFVEDYEELRVDTVEILDNYYDYCEEAVDGKAGLAQYKNYHDTHGKYFDLVITDIKMPEMDGVTLVEEIYKIHASQPIIVLSAHNESEYLLTLINLGIEQFITKPIDHENMLSVLYKVSKKINNKQLLIQANERINFDNSTFFDIPQSTFYHDEEIIKLTKNERIFMDLLAKDLEKICSVEEIVHCFEYEDVFISKDNIRTLVAKLRKKLPVECIESIYGIGYKLFVTF